jgi:hypothetical protein
MCVRAHSESTRFLIASDSEGIIVTPVTALIALNNHIMIFFVSGFRVVLER